MKFNAALGSALALCLLAGTAQAQQLTTTRITSGLTRPTYVCAPPGDMARLFIVEQRGSGGVATQARIKILNLADNTINATPFLTITGLSTGSEQGLLGLAFDPNYATTGRFYVNFTNSAGTTNIVRYTVSGDPNVANPTGEPILTQAQPFSNHNGGWLGFGPDGYLYAALGDGGNFCDTAGSGQNRNTLLGKILRLDVSGTGPGYTVPPTNPFVGVPNTRGEIWAYGLRNPWRNSFDRETGEFYIADVGQDYMEEVNVEPPGVGGRNYGWVCREGYVCSSISPSSCSPPAALCPGCVPNTSPSTDPVWGYLHAASPANCSVSGGYVYRGCAMPELRGTYFFGDYCSAKIWSFRYTGSNITSVTDRTSELAVAGFTINQVVSFGEDASGELYIVDQGGGEIYRIIPRCAANCDGSTTAPVLNVNDFICFQQKFAGADCYANCDGSTTAPVLNVNDFICFQQKFAAGCP
jgi:glucose/arabinose dehydrogenase